MNEIIKLDLKLVRNSRLYFMHNGNYLTCFAKEYTNVLFLEGMFRDIMEQTEEICKR